MPFQFMINSFTKKYCHVIIDEKQTLAPFCFNCMFLLAAVPVLLAGQVWAIIGHLGVFNGAALMESFSCTALHFITSVRQLHLIYKVSEAEGMWSINLRAGDYTRRESGCGGGGEGGGIYHSPTWQDVLQLSLVELD